MVVNAPDSFKDYLDENIKTNAFKYDFISTDEFKEFKSDKTEYHKRLHKGLLICFFYAGEDTTDFDGVITSYYEELANGNELIYYLMDKNAMIMESNLLLSRPAGVNFRTMEPTELICIPKETLIREIEKDQRIIFSMFCSVSNKFLGAMEELRGTRGHSAEWMLCHLLLQFAERYGVAYDGKVLISKTVSFQMLAGMLGVNRVTAVRAMHSLRDLGLVERINGFLCVRSTEGLKAHQELLES